MTTLHFVEFFVVYLIEISLQYFRKNVPKASQTLIYALGTLFVLIVLKYKGM